MSFGLEYQRSQGFLGTSKPNGFTELEDSLYNREPISYSDVRYNQESEHWEIKDSQGKIIDKDRKVCNLCSRHLECDYYNERCSVLS